ncbi:VPS13 family protein [Abortiporus biennis]
MWWLDPGKEVLNILFNRVLAPYVENLDLNQVNYGIGQGQLTLHKLRLKKGALDKFRLPVDVVEGHLGKFTLSLHWMNLGNQPVEIMIEDVYLLVIPSSESTYDPEEEEARTQAAKQERLENAELLHVQGQLEQPEGDQQQPQGLIGSLIAKIVNNLQVTVKNIHIRYEDKLSVPGHPFAAGITLSGFTAISVNDQWLPAFIDSTAGVIHKLAKLESLAVYFDTDAQSLAGLSHSEFVSKFEELIARDTGTSKHQFILQPVTGEGRIKMNQKLDKDTPRFDVQLFFDQIGVLLDDNQYRDAISLVDMYHFYIRQHQYQKFRPSVQVLEENKPKALLQFATTAILDEVRERRRKWTWAYFAERRDDRNRYVDLFKKKQLGPLVPADLANFQALEKKLSYEDIRFYRSIARSQLKKDIATRKQIEEEQKKKQAQSKSTWSGWLWGSSSESTESTSTEAAFSGEMTDEQRQQLYEVLDYDEKAALAEAFQTPRDAMQARIVAKLDRGSFALKSDPHGKNTEIISVAFDAFQSTFIQRPDNFETSLSLDGFAIRDGTTSNTLYPLIVHVQETQATSPIFTTQGGQAVSGPVDPFFYLKFENHPLDERADSALTVRMRYMEIVYHKGYVEAIYHFFKPPSSQLESVEALLNVASQTLEGLRKETRAGFEYALQTHKTIDIQMDLQAPLIIIPEDITTNQCKHLLIDAGHIAIESELANKKAIQEINAKRKQQYTEEDYLRLESMMYDRLSVHLQSAQFIIGDDLESCRKALTSKEHDNLHLLERINIDLQVQNSIVPTAYNLARFKVSGHLPSLQVNLSDTKYKSLMRLVDVAIPKFDDDDGDTREQIRPDPSPFRLPSGFFGMSEAEYTLEDEDNDDRKEDRTIASKDQDEEFFEAEEGGTNEIPDLHQHIFEMHFTVDTLRASLFKSSSDGTEKEIGSLSLGRFSLDFALEKYVMSVNVTLRSISMNVVQQGKGLLEFMSSTLSDSDQELLVVKYTRAQPQSPEFLTVHEGMNQNVDIKITTIIFRAAPEPLVSLYDFIMTTFVPQNNTQANSSQTALSPIDDVADSTVATPQPTNLEKIRVLVKLASIQVIIINEDITLATLSMTTADVAILLRANTLRVNARLGSLSVRDDSPIQTAMMEFKQILSIEGGNFADFQYQTFDPEDKETYKGIRSSVYLNAGSLKVHYLEDPLHGIYIFLLKLAELKGLYDAATEAAAQRAPEIDRMQFDITIKSPIIIFPSNPQQSADALTMRLGELTARNSYEELNSKISAALKGIQLSSTINDGSVPCTLKIIDDIDILAEVVQNGGIDRTQELGRPDTQVDVKVSDVKLNLTEVQYGLLIDLSESISRVVATSPSTLDEVPQAVGDKGSLRISSADVKTKEQNASILDTPITWSTLDVVVAINAIKLHLYDGSTLTEDDFKTHGIARFALNTNTLRLKMLSDGAMEAQVILQSFTMSNTRTGNSKFREIIPAAKHDRNQVMILYNKSGGADPSAMAIITVDSPQVIFAVDLVFALVSFFTSAFTSKPQGAEPQPAANAQATDAQPSPPESTLAFRFDLHDVSVSVLEDDTNLDSQAIRLSIKQILLSQQGILVLSVEKLGMSLTRMGKGGESVRFLDDVDLTFSLDSRSSSSQQMTSIELSMKPVVFRASYRDLNLITTIANKAIELYTKSTASSPETNAVVAPNPQLTYNPSKIPIQSKSVGNAKVLTSKEQLKGSIDGFRLVLIGDFHEQPMLHLRVKPFIIGAKDWSGELQATTTLAVHISYWNLTNSHWEPFIDPWTFTASVGRDAITNGLNLSISARERLNLNISTTFIELLLSTMKMLGQEGEQVLRKSRGSSSPYRIRNRTGYSIFVWSDIDGSADAKDTAAIQIANEKTLDWRFDDWKTMREHVSSTGHNSIGLQFVGKQWDQLRSIPVDREGEYTFTLRPRTEKFSHRVLCEVKVQDNVKVVTLRSTYKVENLTLYPLEVTLVDEAGQPVQSVEKIAPGQDYALPIEATLRNRIRIQPDQGFGYKWSSALRWEDLLAKRSFTIRCAHADPSEAAFRFQAWVDTDLSDVNPRTSTKYPKITLKLRAPIELENLLPYNLEYRIYDKDTDQNWRSYLRKGGIMPVHSVELRHLVLLNVDVQDTVFKPSDFAIINTDGSSDFDVEKRITLRDTKDRKLDLKLNYIRYPNSGGAFKVQIYCPYLVINKTGLPFLVRPARSSRLVSSTDLAGDTRPDVLSQPTPFLLGHPEEQGKNFTFKVGESGWSQAISLDAPSADSTLVIPSQSQPGEEIHLGLSWTEGLGKYKLTKVVTLAPRFIIRNASPDKISFREHGGVPRGRATLNPGERAPLHFMRMGESRLLTMTIPGINAQWSAPINVEDIGSVHFRLKTPGDNGTTYLMRADVKLGDSTIFIVISKAEEGWPFVLENDTDYNFVFFQTDSNHPDNPSNNTVPRYSVPKKSKVEYAWDYPASREKRIMLAVDHSRRPIDIMEIGDLVPFKFSTRQGTRTVSLDVRAEAHKQVLRITNYNAEFSLYKPRQRSYSTLSRQDTISSSQEAFEAVQEEVPPTLTFNLDFEGIGISLINRRMIEVIYFSLNGLKFEYANSPVAQAVNLTCGSLQLDNQLHDALFPVVLQPTPIPKEARGVASLPTVQASVIWLKDQEHGVLFVKYCSVLLQALTIEADEDFLFAVIDLTKIQGAAWDDNQQDILIQHPSEIVEPQMTAEGDELYFEVLELQPIQLAISFMRTERVSSEEKLSIRNPVAVVVNAITMAVGNVNDAPLEMNALAIKDMRLTLPDLEERIMYHYRQEVLRQLYRILGSADFIGNPVGLFTNVSSGVADIFYEPFNGAVMRGNRELGIGIAKGAASFVKKTVFGFSDSFTRITSSVGKGLSAATFDSEYQMQRRMAQRRNRPRHAIYGVAAGAEAFANSVASGFEGVVLKPLEGAETEGAKGFFKGVGKGLIGVVTKPVVGVFDLASNLSEGIRNTTTVFDNPARDRVRLPRHVPADGVLVPYSDREALGQYWMKDLENGAYRNELYVAHINIPGGDNVVLLTASKVISFWSNKLQLDWELPFTHVQGVTIEDTGIRFAHKAGKDHDKFVMIPDKSAQSWFFGQVASVVKAFNARRRMDA